jgi:hypothetical protein
MSSRRDARLRRLEPQGLAVATPPYTPPEPPAGWSEEVLRVLWTSGDFESVVRQTFALPAEAVTRLMEMAAPYGRGFPTFDHSIVDTAGRL